MNLSPTPRRSIIWHEWTYLPPSIAYERFKSQHSSSYRKDSHTPSSPDLLSLDGVSEAPSSKQPAPVATKSTSLSCPRMDRSSSQQAWMPDSPDTANRAESRDGNASIVGSRIDVPDGGLRAWLVVAGAFFMFITAFGLLNAFGTFQNLYLEKEDGETVGGPWEEIELGQVSWIGGAQLCLSFCGGLVSGPIFDNWGARIPMVTGTVFCAAGFLGAGFSRNFIDFFVTQGFLFGAGIALLFYPATSAISEWFDERRPLALGIASSGASLGGIIWSVFIGRYYPVLGPGKVQQVLAAIVVPALVVSCLLVRERKGVAGHNTRGDETQPSERNIAKAIFEPRFVSLSVALLILYTGLLIPFDFIVSFARSNAVEEGAHYKLVAIAYIGSSFGRIGAGLVADYIGCFNTLCMTSIILSLVTICWIWMSSVPALVAFSVLFGLFSGGLVPLGSACVAQTTPDMGYIGLRIGFTMAICSIGALGGGPLSVIILEASGETWALVQILAAACSLLGAIFI